MHGAAIHRAAEKGKSYNPLPAIDFLKEEVFMNKRVFLSGAVLCLLGLLATSAVGYELTERYRLGAVVESLAYVNSGPLAGKVAFIDGWTVYVSDLQRGGYEKLFSVRGIPFGAAPRGLAYLSQGDFAGNFLFSDNTNPNTLFLVTTAGGLVGAVHAQNFSWLYAEGVTQITSGPYQGQVAMLGFNESYTSTYILIFGLQQIGGEINAYLTKDIPNVSSEQGLGLAFLPADFPDPAFANTFVVAESITATLSVVDDQGVQIGAFPGIHYSEGLSYIPDGVYAGKLFLADMSLLEAQVRNLDGSFKIPAPIPLIGMGLFGIQSYTWLSGRQQLYLIGWDGTNWSMPVYLASRLSAGVWRKDDEFRATHFRQTRNITDRAADGTYRLFGIVSARGTPACYAVDQLDAQFALLNTTPLQYTGRSFGNLVYVPGPTTAEDRFIAPSQKAIYSFDASFADPAIIDLSAKVTQNVSRICYDPAAKRYYLIDVTLLRVFDATWNLLDTFDLSGLCPGPFGPVEKFTSGDLRGQIAVLNGDDNELIILNFEYQIAGDLLNRLSADIRAASLPKGIENSLTKKLDNALESAEKKNPTAAVNQIEAFQSEVRVQGGKEIPAELADAWLERTAEIIRGLQAIL